MRFDSEHTITKDPPVGGSLVKDKLFADMKNLLTVFYVIVILAFLYAAWQNWPAILKGIKSVL